MKKSFFALLVAAALLAMPTPAAAHRYDRDDSDHPLRYVGYVLHPFGIAIEYAILRPIHMLVSGPTTSKVFGHDPSKDDGDPMEWE
jgi:hypothetical protein